MDAWRYGIYLLVFTFDISLEINKFHISARPCIILYIVNIALLFKKDRQKNKVKNVNAMYLLQNGQFLWNIILL